MCTRHGNKENCINKGKWCHGAILSFIKNSQSKSNFNDTFFVISTSSAFSHRARLALCPRSVCIFSRFFANLHNKQKWMLTIFDISMRLLWSICTSRLACLLPSNAAAYQPAQYSKICLMILWSESNRFKHLRAIFSYYYLEMMIFFVDVISMIFFIEIFAINLVHLRLRRSHLVLKCNCMYIEIIEILQCIQFNGINAIDLDAGIPEDYVNFIIQLNITQVLSGLWQVKTQIDSVLEIFGYPFDVMWG